MSETQDASPSAQVTEEKSGKHRIGKSRLDIKKLEDVHVPTLKKLIKKACKSPAIACAPSVSYSLVPVIFRLVFVN